MSASKLSRRISSVLSNRSKDSNGIDCNYFQVHGSFGFKSYHNLYTAIKTYFYQLKLSEVGICPMVMGSLVVNKKEGFYGYLTEVVKLPIDWVTKWMSLEEKAGLPCELGNDACYEFAVKPFSTDMYNKIKQAEEMGFGVSDTHTGNWGVDTKTGEFRFLDVGHWGLMTSTEAGRKIYDELCEFGLQYGQAM